LSSSGSYTSCVLSRRLWLPIAAQHAVSQLLQQPEPVEASTVAKYSEALQCILRVDGVLQSSATGVAKGVQVSLCHLRNDNARLKVLVLTLFNMDCTAGICSSILTGHKHISEFATVHKSTWVKWGLQPFEHWEQPCQGVWQDTRPALATTKPARALKTLTCRHLIHRKSCSVYSRTRPCSMPTSLASMAPWS